MIKTCTHNLLRLKALKTNRKFYNYTSMDAYTIMNQKFSSLDVQLCK